MAQVYQGVKTREISFPLGGIGTGCVGLAGNGMLIDWEIFNSPSKGTTNGFTHFAIKAQKGDQLLDARILSGDLQPPYSGEYAIPHYGFGYGVKRDRMTGLPNFPDTVFRGQFPLAHISYGGASFPADVTLTAFNPFIPLNDADSSIPAAFFEFDIVNTTNDTVDYTIAFSCKNPFTDGTSVNQYLRRDGISCIKLGTTGQDSNHTKYGDLTISTQCEETQYQEYWFRGRFADELGTFWKDFARPEGLKNRVYKENPAMVTLFGQIVHAVDTATLAASVKISPGRSSKIRFVLSWSFPNIKNNWRFAPIPGEKPDADFVPPPEVWKNYYHRLFSDSVNAAVYSLTNFDRLYQETKLFSHAIFASTMPEEAVEAVSANLSTLKSPSCLRLENGEMYFFEGCNCTFGSCEGSCTHVLNYAYALPFLYPKLERSLRDLEYRYNFRENGSMTFRLNLPLGNPRWNFRGCVDGQFGTIMKVYREWRISGDDDWLKGLWDKVKKSLEFAWSPENTDKWDADKDGVLEGSQHHTLDMELFGPNAWLTGYYLGALKAASEMAGYLGDKESANEYDGLFNRGKKWVEENLFNGEYYIQQINVTDKTILSNYPGSRTLLGETFEKSYWNDESQEIKYQLGDGCLIDQAAAQWHANNCGLGEIYCKEQVRKALSSIYRYNFKKSMREFVNPCRIYCLYDEAGTVVCQWPRGNKPDVPAPYSQETFNGMEYQAACLMIQNGFTEQGAELVRAVRDRYDGEKRNPWNEFESGSNYVRSMASYALLLAYSGFEYHVSKGLIGFNPVWDGNYFYSFWSLGTGWGHVVCTPSAMEISLVRGSLSINQIKSELWSQKNVSAITLESVPLEFTQNDRQLHLSSLVTITDNQKLIIRY